MNVPPANEASHDRSGPSDAWHVRHPFLRAAGVLASVLVVYYAAPVAGIGSGFALVASVVGLLLGVGVVGWLLVRQAKLQLSAGADESVSMQSLLLLVYIVVPMFALGYFVLERADAGQFVALETKTDALYYTISTLATVGFGDVAAQGQLARALVSIQIAFDLVFVAAIGSLFARQFRQRAERGPVGARREPSGPQDAGREEI
jgi:voltage-gated potassium channel